ncbi:MerR family transcriptional regulator [Nocardia huaxiensis]|uniref:MerR family transcriptional regulator n=1 Tax=Nocardia huaxiensis TaxID=2755382 RepID=A0A7D6VA18_9NOCA|nr:MerR family transcriptional regulator [Nocardia huaxiensis]QLY27877.1 MerR family transcriptional regulator [Nocardia huaxiensis]UFS98723.1 MerR family transcriptional regulator [Nocardia huaxiensis]
MRIGELAKRSGTTPRLLRYYEEQGLIVSSRCGNGYRSYDEALVDRVAQIRGLLDAGLPTRIIRKILPCLNTPRVIHFADPTPEMIETLERERDRMTGHIEVMIRNRDAIAAYLETVLAADRRSRGPGVAGSQPVDDPW